MLKSKKKKKKKRLNQEWKRVQGTSPPPPPQRPSEEQIQALNRAREAAEQAGELFWFDPYPSVVYSVNSFILWWLTPL